MLAAVAIGTVGQWLTVATVAVVALLVWRGGGGAALAVLETANRILERRVHELEEKSRADGLKIAELTAKTDFTLALAPIHAEIQAHDLRAQARAERMLVVLDLIAHRIGPDNGGSHE